LICALSKPDVSANVQDIEISQSSGLDLINRRELVTLKWSMHPHGNP